jgi:hypothetical protein
VLKMDNPELKPFVPGVNSKDSDHGLMYTKNGMERVGKVRSRHSTLTGQLVKVQMANKVLEVDSSQLQQYLTKGYKQI